MATPATASPPQRPRNVLKVRLTSACSYSRLRFSALGTIRVQTDGRARSIAAGRARMPAARSAFLALPDFFRPVSPSSRSSARESDDRDITRPRPPTRTMTPMPMTIETSVGLCMIRLPASWAGGVGGKDGLPGGDGDGASILHQDALAEEFGRQMTPGRLEPVHECRPDPGRDEFAEGATGLIDADLAEIEDLLHDDRITLHAD